VKLPPAALLFSFSFRGLPRSCTSAAARPGRLQIAAPIAWSAADQEVSASKASVVCRACFVRRTASQRVETDPSGPGRLAADPMPRRDIRIALMPAIRAHAAAWTGTSGPALAGGVGSAYVSWLPPTIGSPSWARPTCALWTNWGHGRATSKIVAVPFPRRTRPLDAAIVVGRRRLPTLPSAPIYCGPIRSPRSVPPPPPASPSANATNRLPNRLALFLSVRQPYLTSWDCLNQLAPANSRKPPRQSKP